MHDVEASHLEPMWFVRLNQLRSDKRKPDVNSSHTMTMYALIFPDLCQHMYVCLTAFVQVMARYPPVKPRTSVAISSIVSLLLLDHGVAGPAKTSSEKLGLGLW